MSYGELFFFKPGRAISFGAQIIGKSRQLGNQRSISNPGKEKGWPNDKNTLGKLNSH